MNLGKNLLKSMDIINEKHMLHTADLLNDIIKNQPYSQFKLNISCELRISDKKYQQLPDLKKKNIHMFKILTYNFGLYINAKIYNKTWLLLYPTD